MILTHPPQSANMANHKPSDDGHDSNLRDFNFGLLGFNFPSPYAQQEAASSSCSVQAQRQHAQQQQQQPRHIQNTVAGRSFYYTQSTSTVNISNNESSTESSSEDDAYDLRRPGTAMTTTMSGPGWQYVTQEGTSKLKGNLFKPLRPRFYLVPNVEAPASNSQKRRRAFANKAKAIGSEFLQMNAIILGFGSPEKLAEDAAPVWWDERRIKHTVTPTFVTESMPKVADLRQRLKTSVGFGELSDETYLEWIVSKARRFFLILEKLGIPEQIFGIIDDSWDDNDLPIPMEGVSKLRLASSPNKNLDKRFWEVQYQFLLRGVSKGSHIDFAQFETVPVEFIEKVGSHFSSEGNVNHTKLPGGLGGFGGTYPVEKVAPPNGRWTKTFYTRVTIPLKDEEERIKSPEPGSSSSAPPANAITKTEFMDYIRALQVKPIDHPNIVQLFSSYTCLASPNSSNHVANILYAPFTQSISLESYLRSPSYLYTALQPSERRVLVFNWMTSLASAIAYLHAREVRHGGIRPANILVVGEGKKVLLADAGLDACPPLPGSRISAVRAANHNDMFEFGAPEDYPAHPIYSCPSSNSSSASGGSGGARSSSILGSVHGWHPRRRESHNSGSTDSTGIPRTIITQSDDISTIGTAITSRPSTATGTDTDSMRTATTVLTADSHISYRSDIFSLACVMLEIITFASKRKTSQFRAHRKAAASMRPSQQLHPNGGTFFQSQVTVNTIVPSSNPPSSAQTSQYSYDTSNSWLSSASVASSPSASVSSVNNPRISTSTNATYITSNSRPSSPLPSIRDGHALGYGAFHRKKATDASYHNNLHGVHSWCDMLVAEDENKEKEKDIKDRTHDIVVKDVIGVCRDMIAERPEHRPEAETVVNRLTELAIQLRDVMEEIKKSREQKK